MGWRPPARPRSPSAELLAADLGLPVFLYGESGARPATGLLPSGWLHGLERRVADGELEPDAGPRAIDPRSGAVLVGARAPLVAYNVDLATDDVDVARGRAAVRESGGGLPGVQAIGLRLPRAGRTQVSMNVLDLERSPLHECTRASSPRLAAGSRSRAASSSASSPRASSKRRRRRRARPGDRRRGCSSGRSRSRLEPCRGRSS